MPGESGRGRRCGEFRVAGVHASSRGMTRPVAGRGDAGRPPSGTPRNHRGGSGAHGVLRATPGSPARGCGQRGLLEMLAGRSGAEAGSWTDNERQTTHMISAKEAMGSASSGRR